MVVGKSFFLVECWNYYDEVVCNWLLGWKWSWVWKMLMWVFGLVVVWSLGCFVECCGGGGCGIFF